MVMADVLKPVRAGAHTNFLYEALLALGGSAFVALMARVSIPLPFSPVPITGQTFAVLLVGTLLGSVRGATALGLYLLWGALGLPVFAGGRGGIVHILGPTGGYLLGFVAAAYTVGLLAQRGWDRRPWTCALSMAVGNALIYILGLPWLAGYVGPDKVLRLGLLPFIPGDLLKVLAAVIILPSGWKLLRALGRST